MHHAGPADESLSPLARMVRSEAFPGVLLIACTLFAFAAANSPWSAGWQHLWHIDLSVRFGEFAIERSLAHWINDGLMVLFFFFIGLEIKQEVLDGQLQSLRQAALPIAAALGGMVVPAGIYAAIAGSTPHAASGWGIPMATDIAFALGVLALLGRRVPVGLKVFLASLAIADDLGAVLVIAVFYTDHISWPHLGVGAAVLLASFATSRLGVRKTWPFVIYGLLMWGVFLPSGVHATIAGVLLAFTIPARRRLDEVEFSRRGRQLLDEFDHVGDPDPLTNARQLAVLQQLQRHTTDVQAPLQRMMQGLHPLIAHLIVPVFALANAGVEVAGGLAATAAEPAAQGVLFGLLLGKPAGVLLATLLAQRALRCDLPAGVSWRHVHGAAWLAGIGFTMSLFVNSLAFPADSPSYRAAKVAVLAASFLAGGIGYLLLRRQQPAA